ncbi:MAG: phosphatase [Bacteroidia bacterium]|nr:phosphatase [Bacteroidia bacterium]
MRVAVIDCGTNTFNLLIVEIDNKQQKSKVFNTRLPVKLGEGSINEGYIGPDAFHRALQAIGEFKKLILDYNTEKILAFATSAVRDAANGQQLVNEVAKAHGINIEVIDGNREAGLICLGIREAVQLNESISLIMDIGGGSTEFIFANYKQVFWKHSFNIGAARLLERFQPSDPITREEITALNNFLLSELQPLFQAQKTCQAVELVGSSGAFDSIVEMIHGEMGGEELKAEKTEYVIDLNNHFQITERVIRSTLAQRKQINGLVPMRMDMIVISCLMMNFVLTQLNLNKLRVSTYSLKEGALADFIQHQF